MSFSIRNGLINQKVQIQSIDNTTRNLLWNAIHNWIFYSVNSGKVETRVYIFYYRIWVDFFKEKTNHFPERTYLERIPSHCDHYLSHCTWNRYFDFIEFIIKEFKIFSKLNKTPSINHPINRYIQETNHVLEKQKSAYRIIDEFITPITNDGEIEAVNAAINDTRNIQNVHNHLKQSIMLFSDKVDPDYKNSIKESILAMESLLKIIVSNPKATMSDALKRIKSDNKIEIHPVLINSLNSLYAWAGDENGIRHGSKNDTVLFPEDAQLILVTCSGLISYLIAKSYK